MFKNFIIFANICKIFLKAQIVVVENQDAFNFQGWKVFRAQRPSSFISLQNGIPIFGGNNIFDYLTDMQQYITQLPKHDVVSIKFTLYIWNVNQNPNYFKVQLDDTIKRIPIHSTILFQQTIEFSIPHQTLAILIDMSPQRISIPDTLDWGLANFYLRVERNEPQTIYPLYTVADYSLINKADNFLNNEGWFDTTKSQTIYTCADFALVYPQNLNSQIFRSLILPRFDYMSIYFKVFSTTQLPTISIKIENYQSIKSLPPSPPIYYCSSSNLALYTLSFENIPLLAQQNVQITISTTINSTHRFGIRDFEIYYFKNEVIYPYIPGCLFQYEYQCLDCQEGWNYHESTHFCLPICGDKTIQQSEECDDGNDIPYDGCYQCKFQCKEDCKLCVFGICQGEQQEYKQISLFPICNMNPLIKNCDYFIDQYHCNQVCGNGILEQFEECDDGNVYPYDGCYECKFSCPLNCKLCIQGKCISCKTGYKLQSKYCIPVCGDSIKQVEEVCDDGNLQIFDGCHQCEISCLNGCQFCTSTHCFQCLDGWILNDQGICQQQCGDNQIALMSKEFCDDDSESCLNCELKCAPYCLICINEKICHQCVDNITLFQGECIPYCGDGIVTKPQEQCDDKNEISGDGCFNCQFECQLGCLQCDAYNKCLSCDETLFYLNVVNNQCVLLNSVESNNTDTYDQSSKAQNGSGNNQNNEEDSNNQNDQQDEIDEIVIVNDKNISNQTQIKISEQTLQHYNISKDQLKISKIICPINQILIDDKCFNLCGNGMIDTNIEFCDDGNQDGGDGCSFSCQIEDNYKCININSLSQCQFVNHPKLLLKVLTDKSNSTQIVQITFSEKVKLISNINFEDITNFTITPNVSSINKLIPVTNASTLLQNAKYLYEIKFQESAQNIQLTLSIMESFFKSENDVDLEELLQTVQLGSPFVLTKETQLKVDSVVKLNGAIMFSMAGISSIALVLGNTLLLFNIMELLQQLSYIKYIGYNFPDHLRQFLETYSKISLKPILDQLPIDYYLSKLNGGKLPFYNKNNSQSNKQINVLNQCYLLNVKGCYFSILVSIVTYLICSFITSAKVQNFQNNILYKLKFKNTRFLLFLQQLKCKIRDSCQKIKSNFLYAGITVHYFAIMHQFFFSSLLQFPDYPFNSLFNIINSVNAISSIIIFSYVSLKIFARANQSNKNINQWSFFFQENNHKFWSIYFKPLSMVKIFNYIFLIVFCPDYPEMCSFILSLQSFFFTIYLVKFSPMKSKLDQAKLVIREIIFFILVGTFVVYSYELTDDQKLMAGWIHIGMFVTLMVCTILIDLIKQILEFKLKYQREQRVEQLRKESMYYNNPLQKFIYIEHVHHYQQKFILKK